MYTRVIEFKYDRIGIHQGVPGVTITAADPEEFERKIKETLTTYVTDPTGIVTVDAHPDLPDGQARLSTSTYKNALLAVFTVGT